MALTVTLDKADYMDGVPFEVRGLGLLKNREPYTLTEEQERSFASENGKTVKDALEDGGDLSVSGTPLVSGDITEVLGYDPASVSGDVNPGEPQGDKSPATSMGETYESMAAETVEEDTPAPAVPSTPPSRPMITSLDNPPPDPNEGGDS